MMGVVGKGQIRWCYVVQQKIIDFILNKEESDILIILLHIDNILLHNDNDKLDNCVLNLLQRGRKVKARSPGWWLFP